MEDNGTNFTYQRFCANTDRTNILIYGIWDIKAKVVVYVGKSFNPTLRLFGHLMGEQNNPELAAWVVGALRENNLRLEILPGYSRGSSASQSEGMEIVRWKSRGQARFNRRCPRMPEFWEIPKALANA